MLHVILKTYYTRDYKLMYNRVHITTQYVTHNYPNIIENSMQYITQN